MGILDKTELKVYIVNYIIYIFVFKVFGIEMAIIWALAEIVSCLKSRL